MPRKRYGIPVGATTSHLYFTANSESYSSLIDVLGLADVDADGFDGKIDRINTRSKLRSRIAVRYQLTPTSTRVVRLWCATAKLKEALDGLPTKSYKGKNIVDAYIPNRYAVG